MAKRLPSLIFGTLALFASTAAMAQVPMAAPDSHTRLGLNLVPMPFGSFKTTVPGLGELSADTAFAFGIMPTVDYSVSPYFFIGLAPQYTFNVKGDSSSGDAASMLDFFLRLGGNAPVADRLQLYAYVAPGYSIVMPPQGDSSRGFTLGFHGGGMFDLTPNAFVNLELGYQLGYQSVHDVDYKVNYFQIGLGFGIRL